MKKISFFLGVFLLLGLGAVTVYANDSVFPEDMSAPDESFIAFDESDEDLFSDSELSVTDNLFAESVLEAEDLLSAAPQSFLPASLTSYVSAAAPQWASLANVSVTFVIHPDGNANFLFTVSAKSGVSGGIKVKSYIERKSIGIIWSKVDVGVKNNEWTDSTSGNYISTLHNTKLKDYGIYRVVLAITCGGDVYTRTSEFKYEKGFVPGDADGNGKLNAADARKILRVCAKLEKFTASQVALCDLNGDDKITSADARLALRISAGLI